MRQYQGFINGFERGILFGWAAGMDDAAPINVGIYVRKERIGAALANQPRADLQDAAGARSGFSFAIPEAVRVQGRYAVRALAEDKVELGRSPFAIAEPPHYLYRKHAGSDADDLRLELPRASGSDLPFNFGLALLNRAAPEPQRTVLVIGHARSGTTMVSRVLDRLGFPMGDTDPPQANCEDPEFADLLALAPELDIGRLRALIELRNARADAWGFKLPAALQHLPLLIRLLRNPRVVFVFRDILSVACRENNAVNAGLLNAMRSVIEYQAGILDFIHHTDLPCLLVSYEKALQNPLLFCAELADFAGVTGDAAQAVQHIEANNPRYLNRVREVRIQLGLEHK